jgi:hypothetical protein
MNLAVGSPGDARHFLAKGLISAEMAICLFCQ